MLPDSDYYSARNLRTIKRWRIKGYMPQKHGTTSVTATKTSRDGSLIARMTAKLKRADYRTGSKRLSSIGPVEGYMSHRTDAMMLPAATELQLPRYCGWCQQDALPEVVMRVLGISCFSSAARSHRCRIRRTALPSLISVPGCSSRGNMSVYWFTSRDHKLDGMVIGTLTTSTRRRHIDCERFVMNSAKLPWIQPT
ncbi:hypothetical protein [Bradyrhizobium sp. USDA 4504]